MEKTDVRVTGVVLGRLVDSTTQSTDGADTFLPTDTVYASVRTKGASPQTVLGVRWEDSTGFEVNGDNRVIRPTGDTSTLFEFHHMTPMAVGRYTLAMRVNGKVVKTRNFVVTTDAEARSLAPKTVTRGLQPRFAGVKSLFSDAVARVSDAVESLRDRGDKDQSPFEWRGLRGGMSFTRLDRITNPGAPWKCTPFLLSAVGLERDIALQSRNFSAGHVHAIVDTVGKRVLSIGYSVAWMKPTDPQKVELERELTELADKWNAIGVIRRRATQGHGPHLAEWVTPDSVWKAGISYYGDLNGVSRPQSFEIEEIQLGHRLETEIPDSIEGQLHNPESPYYHRPNVSCAALLEPSG
ncbi:MAG TPA: hypothetical protein VJ865_14040 [Gemmatimonadaceae bacterium]|nr:hypothetical protein [Gemmatimonadaceae bacterium]